MPRSIPSWISPVGLGVDLVVLTVRDDELTALAVRRANSPYKGRWALPGGFVEANEDIADAAARELLEETGVVRTRAHIEQLGTFGAPKRDPRMRVITVAHLALAPDLPTPQAGSDAADARWLPVARLTGTRLAFDHDLILAAGLERARAKLEYTPLGTAFCAPEFTVAELRRVYEIVWDQVLDPRNFHRKVTRTEGFLAPVGSTTTRDGGRPAQLYRRGTVEQLHPRCCGPIGDPVTGYPRALSTTGQIEPAPRRVRGVLGTRTVVDTTSAIYVWEWPYYPQYYLPVSDFAAGALVDEHRTQHLDRGTVALFGLAADGVTRPGCARVFGADALPGLAGMVRLDWNALDAWYEEREQIFVHPRNPYVRVDALRSDRQARIELDGVLLAESSAPVLVFETGLPTRYYLDRDDVDFGHLEPSDTVTACPYKGRTTGYWSVRIGDTVHADLAWSYNFPTRQLLPVAGLVAFYDEKVDVTVDGIAQPRPATHL